MRTRLAAGVPFREAAVRVLSRVLGSVSPAVTRVGPSREMWNSAAASTPFAACSAQHQQHETNAAMPPYSEKILSDDELADIYAYLKAVPKPVDYKTIPLLKD